MEMRITNEEMVDAFLRGRGLHKDKPDVSVGLIFPRSSICKEQLLLSHAVGVLDSGYRGEVSFKFKPSMALDEGRAWAIAFREQYFYRVGDRIGQMTM